ncbi:MAG TPA: rhomboid family intramembrane serine protease [Mucilaginibacter sp.]|jgi:membrane associated rhomboid family serine protease|nr:rhomboid family intramembrane serine protease [Mucilaginibacter sp.]HWD90200.1 rhomboid family intramembrane serine protease [Mucilaginibacter sp.]
MEISSFLQTAPVASAIFVITLITTFIAFYNDQVYEGFILHPYYVYQGKKLYTLITSGFIHLDLMHLFFNMFTFYYFAPPIEAVLGHWQFLLLYIVSMVLADLPSVAKHHNNFGYRSLGASGAISAVIFSFILFAPFTGMGILFIPVSIPAVVFGALYLVYCSYASKKQWGNINHDAHLFGAIAGLMITAILQPHVLGDFVHIVSAKVQSWTH